MSGGRVESLTDGLTGWLVEVKRELNVNGMPSIYWAFSNPTLKNGLWAVAK